jgi:CBS domain-containing protein
MPTAGDLPKRSLVAMGWVSARRGGTLRAGTGTLFAVVPLARPHRAVYLRTMRISDVVRRKGDAVVTVRPDETVERLLELLEEHRIGALVVSEDGESVAGIVSERDVVRHLHSDGVDVLREPISQIMTSEVTTCDFEMHIEELARIMTELRIRHVPVVVDGKLSAIVSIGDVVKNRIDELQTERDQLVGYIQQ